MESDRKDSAPPKDAADGTIESKPDASAAAVGAAQDEKPQE
jgi:hypothetical protein